MKALLTHPTYENEYQNDAIAAKDALALKPRFFANMLKPTLVSTEENILPKAITQLRLIASFRTVIYTATISLAVGIFAFEMYMMSEDYRTQPMLTTYNSRHTVDQDLPQLVFCRYEQVI